MRGIVVTAVAGLAAVAAAAAAVAAAGVQPGMWETASTVVSADLPGAPPQVTAAMTGRTTTVRHCMTPEEAAGGPQSLMRTNKACTFAHFSMAGGRLDSEMVCRQDGATNTVTSSGTYTPTTYAATAKMVTTGPGKMTMTISLAGRRVGDCR